jgi:hypothetical protein
MQTSGSFSQKAMTKASFVSLLFFFWALIVIFKFDINPPLSIVIFYILMLINTYFSVRAFTSITPSDKWQMLFDILLGLCLAASPLLFASPANFVLINLFLFIIATLKYIYLIKLVGFSKLLFEKIRIDVLGILLCALCLVGILNNYATLSLKLFAFIFFLANIYVLYYKPLYRLEHHFEKIVGNFIEDLLKK